MSHANMAMIDMSNRRLEPILVSPLRGIVAKLHSKLAVLLFVSFVGLSANLTPASAAPTGAAAVALAASPSAPGAGILPHHVRLMTQLVPGEMIVRKNGQVRFLAVGQGLVEVTGDRVSIVTDMAVATENIDEAKAEEARQRAAARLREKISSAEVASVNAALARSLAQLRVKRRHLK